GAHLAVHPKEALDLGQDAVEGPGLVAASRLDGVAVHGIAAPDDRPPGTLHGLDEARKVIGHLVCAEAADQRHPARLVGRIDLVEELEEVLAREARAALDADGVLDPGEILGMPPFRLACT